MSPPKNVKLVGTLADHILRDFLTRADQPYEWFDEESGRELLARHGVTEAGLPVVVIDDEIVLVRPTLEQLADALGVRAPPKQTDYDVVIVGAGPAGLAAAVYAASDGLSVAVPERDVPGGQAAYTPRIENYFGIDPLGPAMTGARLARIGGRQAEMFGAELLLLRGAVESRPLEDGRHEVTLSTGEQLRARALIGASGVTWRRLDVPGIDDLLGRGVYFGAGRSEAPLLQGRKVIVVGGGNSAGQAALHLAGYADRVTMICRGPSLANSLSGYLLERIQGEAFLQAFRSFNALGSDDPSGANTAPGANFAVPGLRAAPGDADGKPGEVIFPTPAGGPGLLRENVTNVKLGMPHDLNGDGVIDGLNHSLDYKLLPVLVRVRWQSADGTSATVELKTILANY